MDRDRRGRNARKGAWWSPCGSTTRRSGRSVHGSLCCRTNPLRTAQAWRAPQAAIVRGRAGPGVTSGFLPGLRFGVGAFGCHVPECLNGSCDFRRRKLHRFEVRDDTTLVGAERATEGYYASERLFHGQAWLVGHVNRDVRVVPVGCSELDLTDAGDGSWGGVAGSLKEFGPEPSRFGAVFLESVYESA